MDFAFDGELASLRELGRRTGRERAAPSVASRDRDASWDPGLFAELARSGVARPLVPSGHGGLGACALEAVALLEGFGEGSGDAGLSLAAGAHGVLCAALIATLGTKEQRDRYLAPMASGEWPAGIALSECDGGAAESGAGLRAIAAPGGWLVEGAKPGVVNGSAAHHFVVTARTGGGERTAFVVDRRTPGIRVLPELDPFAARTCGLARLLFTECFVSGAAVLGAPGAATGQAVPLLAALERTCLHAPWLGIARELLRRALDRAGRGTLFGGVPARSQSVRAALVDARTAVELGSDLLYRAAWGLDRPGRASRQDTAVARLFLGRAVRQVARSAAELAGPAPDDLLRRAHRDSFLLAAARGEQAVLPVIAGALLRPT